MSKKFSIIIELDLNKLLTKVEEYTSTNKDDPYIFMSKSTIDELNSIDAHYYEISSSNFCRYFRGYKVFCDNTLEFGEVEIR